MQYPQTKYNQQRTTGPTDSLISQPVYGNNVRYTTAYNIQKHEKQKQRQKYCQLLSYFQNNSVQNVLPNQYFYQQQRHQHRQYKQHLYQSGFQQQRMQRTTKMNDTEIAHQILEFRGEIISINDCQLHCSSTNKKFFEEYQIGELIAEGGNGAVYKGTKIKSI